MFLSEVTIKNFRCFDNSDHIFTFNKGLNLLVGENDSGKTAIIDAIRYVLGTTDSTWTRVEITDFYNEDYTNPIFIQCKFEDLTDDEKASFLECLTHIKENDFVLYLNYTYECKHLFSTPRIFSTISTGSKGDGICPSQEAREILKTTYLRPLRDSYLNMQAGKGSRLSQILLNVETINKGEKYENDCKLDNLSLTGIADLSNNLLNNNSQIKDISNKITERLTNELVLSGENIKTSLEVSNNDVNEMRKLITLLEKLDLKAKVNNNYGKIGLGTSNILSMACEMLLASKDYFSLMLIEEPEAHIHPQRQLRLIKSLEELSNNNQVILTTHSPYLSSVVKLENLNIINSNKCFPMNKNYTQLNDDDYYFMERYLDATKANLFFAKSVIIVEGPSEELLLPIIAKLLGRDFSRYGVSIINARGIGLDRFARIFKRKNNNEHLNIKVACITDRDIRPDCSAEILYGYADKTKYPKERKWILESETDKVEKKEKALTSKEKLIKEDGYIDLFISDNWTLEYDLAFKGLNEELLQAIIVSESDTESESANKNKIKKAMEIKKTLDKYNNEEEKCTYLYSLVCKGSKPVIAQNFGKILEDKFKSKEMNIDILKSKLPSYILQTISFVTGGEL